MIQESVSQFFQAAKQDAALREILIAVTDSDTCVKIAEKYGYHFTTEELQTGLSELSEEALGEFINPGVAPRRHLKPR
jgi:predicted ribosomally synthesized peptide with nif11-like leader